MLFSWDVRKAEANLTKHGISFEIAQTVFDDPLHLSIIDKKIGHEERWVTIGQTSNSQTVVVVHTYHTIYREKEIIRIISARRATRKEKKQYEEGI